MRTVRVVVIGVSITVTPVTGVVVAGFQTTLLRRFPFIVRLDLDTLFATLAVLVLVARIQVFLYLFVVGVHVETELVVCTADI